MSLSNFPDGMSERDIPGYFDVECPDCMEGKPDEGCEWCEGTGMADSRDLDDRYYVDDSEPEPDFPSRYYANDWV